MAKYLDGTGLGTLWSKIKGLVQTEIAKVKADITDAVSELNSILGDTADDPAGGSGGGSANSGEGGE